MALVYITPMTNDVGHLPCIQWPVVHSSWRNVNTNTLSVYKLDVFVVELSFFIYCAYQPFTQLANTFCHFIDCLSLS